MTPTTRTTGVDVARETIRAAILRGEVATGCRLPLTSLSEQLGLSVTPVREAMRDLAAEGLIDLDPHKGARVHTATMDELREVCTLRIMLEPRAMAEVALSEEEHRAVACIRAGRIAERMQVEVDLPTWAEANRAFHTELAEPIRATWPRLYSMVLNLRNISLLPMAWAIVDEPDHKHQDDRDHDDLLLAVRSGDANRASQLTKRHLERAQHALLQSDGTPRPTALRPGS